MSPPRRTALITGASAGIGAAFAEAYAARGCDLILTARRLDRLDALKERLAGRYGAAVTVVDQDLAAPNAADTLFTDLTDRGLTVDILVNNAGYGVNRTFMDADWQTHADFLAVMLDVPVHLTHLVLPGMTARGYGRIIQVASLAALLPGSTSHTLYAAVKAALVKFSESLFLELEGTGVHVNALCPGLTYSEFHDVNGTRDTVSRVSDKLWMEADDVVSQGIDAVEAGRTPLTVPGRMNRSLAGLGKILPHGALMGLSRWRARRTADD